PPVSRPRVCHVTSCCFLRCLTGATELRPLPVERPGLTSGEDQEKKARHHGNEPAQGRSYSPVGDQGDSINLRVIHDVTSLHGSLFWKPMASFLAAAESGAVSIALLSYCRKQPVAC